MTRGKKWKLVVLSSFSLVCVLAGWSCLRGTAPQVSEDQPMVLKGPGFPVQALAFGPDETSLTAASYPLQSLTGDAELIVWDSGTGLVRAMYIRPLGELMALTFTSGGRRLACAGRDGTVGLCQTALRQKPVYLDGVSSPVSALAFSPDGKRLAGADHLRITVWDAATGRQLMAYQGLKQRPCALAFASRVELLASGTGDGTVQLWDTHTGEARDVLSGHQWAVFALAFTADSRFLASADLGGVVKVWDMAARVEWVTLGESGNGIAAVAFSPDGKTLAVAVSSTVQLWDVPTLKLVAELTGHEGKVKCLSFSLDGSRLASGSNDRTVRVWPLGWYRKTRP
jgi:WD40 repeat protein